MMGLTLFAARPSIIGLLFSGGPSAVIFRVSFFIIDTVKRVIFTGFSPHIGKEIFVVFPTGAYCNSTSPVVRELGVIRIITSLAHTGPRIIGSGSSFCASLIMDCISLDKLLNPSTSTAFSMPRHKLITGYNTRVSAFTLAPPVNPAFFSGESIYNGKRAKVLSAKVYKSIHNMVPIGAVYSIPMGAVQ